MGAITTVAIMLVANMRRSPTASLTVSLLMIGYILEKNITVRRPEPDPQAIAALIFPEISATEPIITPPMIRPNIDHLITNLPSSRTDKVKVESIFEDREKKELMTPCIHYQI